MFYMYADCHLDSLIPLFFDVYVVVCWNISQLQIDACTCMPLLTFVPVVGDSSTLYSHLTQKVMYWNVSLLYDKDAKTRFTADASQFD